MAHTTRTGKSAPQLYPFTFWYTLHLYHGTYLYDQ